jgi:hypothetical protein
VAVTLNPLTQYLMIGKLVALLGCIALICYQSSQIHRWHKHSEGLSAKLEAITTAKNTQKQTTAEKIKVVTRTIHDADERARIVEKAPPAPNCATKPEIMAADL